jgi:hypothetical protein
MERSPWSLVRDRNPRRKRQPAAPELPGAVAEPAGFGAQHDFNQTGFADRLLQQEGVVPGSEIHGLRDDAIFGMRLSADRLPPDVFPAKFRDHCLQNVICRHAP